MFQSSVFFRLFLAHTKRVLSLYVTIFHLIYINLCGYITVNVIYIYLDLDIENSYVNYNLSITVQ